jgi:hypothetical protein
LKFPATTGLLGFLAGSEIKQQYQERMNIMRIFLTILCVIGAWIATGYILPLMYSIHIDVPGIEISQNVLRYAAVAVCSAVAWAKLD